jgi:hypothetical protein
LTNGRGYANISKRSREPETKTDTNPMKLVKNLQIPKFFDENRKMKKFEKSA